MLTLQQAETVPDAATTSAAPAVTTHMMVAPVIPEDVPLQCSYNASDQAWHCSYARWFREPSTSTIIIMGVMGFGLGFLIAAFPPVREALKTAKTLSPY